MIARHPQFPHLLENTVHHDSSGSPPSRSARHHDSLGSPLSRSARRRERRREQSSSYSYSYSYTNSVSGYGSMAQRGRGGLQRGSTISRISPAGGSSQFRQLVEQSIPPRSARESTRSRGPTHLASGQITRGALTTREFVVGTTLPPVGESSRHRGRGSPISSYRTGHNRGSSHAPQTTRGSHSSVVTSATPTDGRWSVVTTGRARRVAAPPSALRGSHLPSHSNRSTSGNYAVPDTGSSANIAALERTWAVVPSPPAVIDDWTEDRHPPTRSSLAETAGRASLLLHAFARATPLPDVGGITPVQQSQLTDALTALLSITREVRVQAALANEPLEPLPVADDVALRPDSACIVCYARLADIVLLPCAHLTLCEVWISPRRWWSVRP